MIVVDASVIAAAVGDDGAAGRAMRSRIASEVSLSAPDLVDVETTSVLRKQWLNGAITARRFSSAVADLLALPIVRFPTGQLMIRAFGLRSNLTPYDASYVALAEHLGCPLVTADRAMARAPGIRCRVELVAV